MYVIVFDRLSPGKSEDRLLLQPHFGWVTSRFFFIFLSLLLCLLPENIEREHGTQNTTDDTPEKCTQEKISEGYHSSCRLNSALQDWKNEFPIPVFTSKKRGRLGSKVLNVIAKTFRFWRKVWCDASKRLGTSLEFRWKPFWERAGGDYNFWIRWISQRLGNVCSSETMGRSSSKHKV